MVSHPKSIFESVRLLILEPFHLIFGRNCKNQKLCYALFLQCQIKHVDNADDDKLINEKWLLFSEYILKEASAPKNPFNIGILYFVREMFRFQAELPPV